MEKDRKGIVYKIVYSQSNQHIWTGEEVISGPEQGSHIITGDEEMTRRNKEDKLGQ